jgi:hypothetical protein
MKEPKTIDFTLEEDHAKWISDNRTTGLIEISCDVIDGIIKVEYIKLF